MELVGILVGAVISFVGMGIKHLEDKKRNKKEEERWKLEKEQLELENIKLRQENSDVTERLQFLDRVLDLEFVNEVVIAVERIFEHTKADRFLILIAKNGVSDFNIVNVVFEQHKKKEYRINAIARYRNVHIDHPYKQMLKEAELKGIVQISTEAMPPSILKTFYEIEGVKHSKIRHLARKPINEGNDFLMFSSLSTHDDDNFTRQELAFIKTQFEGVILPSLDKVLD